MQRKSIFTKLAYFLPEIHAQLGPYLEGVKKLYYFASNVYDKK